MNNFFGYLLVVVAFPQFLGRFIFTDALIIDQDFKELQYMNLSADPCDNFYKYTCGNFESLHPLEDGQALIDQFTLLEKELDQVAYAILKTPISNGDSIAVRKAKMAFETCEDQSFQDTITMIGPEVDVIKKYGGFPVLGKTVEESNEETVRSFNWSNIADIGAEFGISVFFAPSLYYDTQNASRNILRISSDAMEIPVQFRPKLLHTSSYEEAIEEGFQAMTNRAGESNENKRVTNSNIPAMEILLRKMVLKIKRFLGSERTDQYLYERVANISNFMKGIYYGGYIPENTSVYPITPDNTTSVATLDQLNAWTIRHFGEEFQFDWIEYVRRLLKYTHVDVDGDFLVLRPIDLHRTLYGIINWVKMNDEEIVKSSALLRAFVYTASDSDSETRTYFEEYLNATGKTVLPRWLYCTRKIIDATGTLSLGLAVAYKYQKEHFDISRINSALSLIENLRATFKEIIEETSWMDNESKAAAQIKADKIVTLLAYPSFIRDEKQLDAFYKNLQITSWDNFSNSKTLRAFKQAHTLNMLSERVRTAWEKSPFDTNAYYNRQNNRIIFPVAMLNPMFFQGTAGLLDYSRIGMVIAHEITHGFDSQGFLYNPDGVIEPWWSNVTITNFSSNTKCFINQYDNYQIPEINATISGRGSLNENLADNGGLRNAFRTITKLLSNHNDDYTTNSTNKRTSFTNEQLFFIGYGTMWCNSESTSYLKSLVQSCNTTTSCHARADMRVNGVVSNMEEFASAFNCPVGSAMNPLNKCRLW